MVLSQFIHPTVSTPGCSKSNGFSAVLSAHMLEGMPAHSSQHAQFTKYNTGAVTPWWWE